MPDPAQILPPVGEPVPEPVPTPRIVPARKLVCEFCGCELAPSGEFVRLSDQAKKFRGHEQTVEARDARIAELEKELRTTNTALAELKAKEKKGWL